METSSHTLRGVLCAILGGVCWGVSGTLSEYAFTNSTATPLELTCFRTVAAGVILLTWSFFHNRAQFLEALHDKRALLRLLIYGVVGLVGSQYAYTTAIVYSNAATTTVLQNLNLVFILIITCIQLRKAPNLREWTALFFAIAGTWLLATGGDFHHLVLSPQGLFWGIATAITVTLYTIIPKPLLARWSNVLVSGYGMLLGGITTNLAVRSWRLDFASVSATGWLAMCGVVVTGSLMATTLYLRGVADIGPVKASLLAITEPVVAAILGMLWLGTRFTRTDLLGFAFIFVTIWLLSVPAKDHQEGDRHPHLHLHRGKQRQPESLFPARSAADRHTTLCGKYPACPNNIRPRHLLKTSEILSHRCFRLCGVLHCYCPDSDRFHQKVP